MNNSRISPGVASPCINVCQMNEATGWCEGCHRTLDEIAFWSVLDESDKEAVWALLPARRAQMPTVVAAPGTDPNPIQATKGGT
jgi:predicted Fe-S protein YdhL (DUF1289 family)